MADLFRWLHLSDIHYREESPDQNSIHTNLLEQIKKVIQVNPIDCIVITGDFFLKGSFNNTLDGFLTDLYKQCSNICKWNWNEGSLMERLFVCPGNHDLNRNASLDHGTIYRPDILNKLVSNCTDGLFVDQQKNKKSHKLMTSEAFYQYDTKILSKSSPKDIHDHHKYECNVFQIKTETPNPVIFVGINTELYAGQIKKDKSEMQREAEKNFNAFQSAHNRADYKNAAIAYRQYSILQHQLINTCGINDDGKLCFISNRAQKYVESVINKISPKDSNSPDPIIIIFGHRPLSSLTKEAQKAEANFAETICRNSQLYLCGHSHRPGHKDIKIDRVANNSYKQCQICIGGSFADSTNYNDMSFSIGTIKWQDNHQKPKISGTIYLWKDLFYHNEQHENSNGYAWVRYDFEPDLSLNVSNPSYVRLHSHFSNKTTSDYKAAESKKSADKTTTEYKSTESEKTEATF